MKKLLVALLFSFSIFLFKTSFVLAAVDDIPSFASKITLHQDGTINVTESINYDFDAASRHGIFRDIPLFSKVGDLYRVIDIQVEEVQRDGTNEPFNQNINNNILDIKIGNPSLTITGTHLYTISYLVKNAVGSNFSDHDEIYWNVTGSSWPGIIEKASANITTNFPVQSNSQKCFTGSLGSTESSCNFLDANQAVTSRVLNSGEGFTVVVSYPVGTFPKSTLSKNQPSEIGNLFYNSKGLIWDYFTSFNGWLDLLAVPVLLFGYFLKKHKRRFGPSVVNFDIPKDSQGNRLLPAEAGTVDSTDLDQNDVAGTIFDLAIRKYIKIEQVKEQEKVLGVFNTSKEDYQIIRLKDVSDLTNFEQLLLLRLFRDGDTVEISSLKKDFYQTFNLMKKEIFVLLIKRGFYLKNPNSLKGLGLIIGFVLIGWLNIFLLGGSILILSALYKGRTQLGDLTDHQIDGLKIFLKSRMREYNWNVSQLQIVEQMIPYAMALGYIKEFMEQVKISYPNYVPVWYVGTTPFYESFSNFTTIAVSSSSGMSGGSAGGGGGGGGGGSW